MVLVFSSNANNSDEIKREVVLAGQNKLLVIPVRVEDVVPNDTFKYQFATRQWIDLFKDWERQIEALASWIANVLENEPAGDAKASTSAGASAPSRLAVSRETNDSPMHYFLGAFLIFIGAFLLVFLTSAVVAMGPAAGRYVVTGQPNSFAQFLPEGLPTVYPSVLITGIYLIITIAIFVTGLATTWRRKWARFLGIGFCIVGCAVASNLTFEHLTLAFAPNEIPDSVSQGKNLTPFLYAAMHPQSVTYFTSGPGLIALVVETIFAISMGVAGGMYLWAWQSPSWFHRTKERGADVGSLSRISTAFVLFLFSLTAASVALMAFVCVYSEYFGYQIGDATLWSAVLLFVDLAAFIYLRLQFRRDLSLMTKYGGLRAYS